MCLRVVYKSYSLIAKWRNESNFRLKYSDNHLVMVSMITLFLREIMNYLLVQKSAKFSHDVMKDIIIRRGQCMREWFSPSHHALKKTVFIFILK